MIIGILKETKNGEGRVSCVPQNVEELVQKGHTILIEHNAGLKSGFPDEQYLAVGAKIIDSKQKIYSESQLIVKVKEPIGEEIKYLNPGPVLFSYLHLSFMEDLTRTLMKNKATVLGFESVVDENGQLPLLIPMSEIAGRIGVIKGAELLGIKYNGSGLLLGGAAGIYRGCVVIVGGGTAGRNAAIAAFGLGAQVIVLENNLSRIQYLIDTLPRGINVSKSNLKNVRESVKSADLLIGTVLIPSARAPRIVTREMVKSMRKGSVIVDISIDQGGCIETSRPTSHEDPTYIEEGIIHYCVTNMPGAYPRTSTEALSESISPYLAKLASEEQIENALKKYIPLKNSVNIFKRKIALRPIADAFQLEYTPIDDLLKNQL